MEDTLVVDGDASAGVSGHGRRLNPEEAFILLNSIQKDDRKYSFKSFKLDDFTLPPALKHLEKSFTHGALRSELNRYWRLAHETRTVVPADRMANIVSKYVSSPVSLYDYPDFPRRLKIGKLAPNYFTYVSMHKQELGPELLELNTKQLSVRLRSDWKNMTSAERNRYKPDVEHLRHQRDKALKRFWKNHPDLADLHKTAIEAIVASEISKKERKIIAKQTQKVPAAKTRKRKPVNLTLDEILGAALSQDMDTVMSEAIITKEY